MKLNADALRKLADFLDSLAMMTERYDVRAGADMPVTVQMVDWPHSLNVHSDGAEYVLGVGSEY